MTVLTHTALDALVVVRLHEEHGRPNLCISDLDGAALSVQQLEILAFLERGPSARAEVQAR